MIVNPYQPPKSSPEDQTSDFVIIRQKHIFHARCLQLATIVYWLSGLASLGVGLAEIKSSASPIFGAVFFLYGLALLVVSFGIHGLKNWIRAPVAILSTLGLLAIPIGTIFHALVLYLVFSKNGKIVTSPEHASIIKVTPYTAGRPLLFFLKILGLIFMFAAVVLRLKH